MRRFRGVLLSMTLGLAALPVQAHSDAELDARQTAHGGQLRMAGGLHLELVLAREGDATQPRPIVVHVGNHADEPQPVAGGQATVTLLAPKMTPVRVELTPNGASSLAGSAVYPDDPALKAVVRISLPDQPVEQARFEPLAPRAADEHHHDHEGHDHKGHDHQDHKHGQHEHP